MSRFFQDKKAYLLIVLFVLLTSCIAWLPFFPQLSLLGVYMKGTDTGTVYRNYDGPLYLIVAKTWYEPQEIQKLKIDVPLSPTYYAAHLPLYPAVISFFSIFMGYLKATIFSTVFTTILLALFFYYMVKNLKVSNNPLLLTCVMLMLPRFLIVRSVGAPESLFILFTLMSLFFFEKKNYLGAGITGGLATMTKLPGILLFVAYVSSIVTVLIRTRKFDPRWLYLLLVPFGLLVVCLIYQQQMHDFFAYWHTQYVVPMPYPFSAFDARAKWVGTHWLEDVVLYFALYALTLVYSFRHRVSIFFHYTVVFFIGVSLVQHRDIARYALPLWPITCIIFERFLTSKKTIIAFLVIVPAIYFYAWNFMAGNVMPVSDWAAFL